MFKLSLSLFYPAFYTVRRKTNQINTDGINLHIVVTMKFK